MALDLKRASRWTRRRKAISIVAQEISNEQSAVKVSKGETSRSLNFSTLDVSHASNSISGESDLDHQSSAASSISVACSDIAIHQDKSSDSLISSCSSSVDQVSDFSYSDFSSSSSVTNLGLLDQCELQPHSSGGVKLVGSACVDTANKNEGNQDLFQELQNWSRNATISNNDLRSLLRVLKKHHPELPIDPRTLRSVPSVSEVNKVQQIAGGDFYYFGIQFKIIQLFEKVKLKTDVLQLNSLLVQFNIDGLPLFKSSSGQVWPILCRIKNLEHSKPFAVGLYYGKHKPISLQEYLKSFCHELKECLKNGIEFLNHHFSLEIDSFVCDAPARSFLKNTKGHSGYFGCDRCLDEGLWQGKMTFPNLDAVLRTDESFCLMLQAEHHKGTSPLVDLGIGLVSQFPLDYMHLVCLGVTRRLILSWIKGPLKCRQSSAVINSISSSLIGLIDHVPREFARRPRTLKEIDRWKATEFRQFLLYSGPVILSNILPQKLYCNFMLLSVAIRILLSGSNSLSSPSMINYAGELLKIFVKNFGELYGKENLVYNVHCLIHLADDAQKYGLLDCISSFPFETYLGKLKKLIRKPSQPLVQLVKRLQEKDIVVDDDEQADVTYRCKRRHFGGPLVEELKCSHQFSQLFMPLGFLSTRTRDSCVQLEDGSIVIIINFVVFQNETYIIYDSFGACDNFFAYPVESKFLGIFLLSCPLNKLQFCSVDKIAKKVVLLPVNIHSHQYVAMPFLHNV